MRNRDLIPINRDLIPIIGENMKSCSVLFILFLLRTLEIYAGEEVFHMAGKNESFFMDIAFDFEGDFDASMDLREYDSLGLSLFEMDERDSDLLPWAAEGLEEDLTGYIEKRAKEIVEEWDDVFVYDIPLQGQKTLLKPTLERIPQKKKSLFEKARPFPSKGEE